MNIEKLKNLAISDNGFIFNPITGDTFTLNKTAVFILNELKLQQNENTIISKIIEKFEVDSQDATNDFNFFITQLKTYDLI